MFSPKIRIYNTHQYSEGSKMFSLQDLPPELLLRILHFLDITDLCSVRLTCKQFRKFLDEWSTSLLKKFKTDIPVRNHVILNRTFQTPSSAFDNVRISKNWKRGLYRDKCVIHLRTKYRPRIYLEKDLLWHSRGKTITPLVRSNKGIRTDCSSKKYKTVRPKACKEDISCFVIKENFIFGGHLEGGFWLWDRDKNEFIFDYQAAIGDVDCVDFNDKVLVAGTRNGYVNIYKNIYSRDGFGQSCCLEDQINLFHGRPWSVEICQENSAILAVGSSATTGAVQFLVFDMESQSYSHLHRSQTRGDGILQVKWENPSTLWTCSYGGNLAKWDLRTGNAVQTWADPFGSALYCFQNDGCYSTVTGTQDYGRTVLWDIRQPHCVQMYFIQHCKSANNSSPVYGLAFDTQFLFTATDRHLNVLDFATWKGNLKDYQMFSNAQRPRI